MKRIKGIKIIAWDIDNTLYFKSPSLEEEIEKTRLFWLSRRLGLSLEKTKQKLQKYYYKTKNYAKAITLITGLDNNEYQKIFSRIDRKKHHNRDEKLISLFKKLKKYRHFIISNASRKHCLQALESFGLDPNIFERILTAEEFNRYKPEKYLFEYLLKITSIPAEEHLYIGDSEEIDISPAKSLGIKTAIVWKESSIADNSAKSIYEVSKYLL